MAEQNEQIVDELLVMKCQDGRMKALDQLVSRWQKRLWRYAYRLTGDLEGAWDVTQESWLGVIRGLPRLHDPARFRPWIYQIVTRKAEDGIAGRIKVRRQHTETGVRAPEPEPLSARVAADEIRELLDRLPRQSRIILTLRYLENLPIAEIACVLGIPEGTVKSRLYAARDELKALWQQASE